MRWWLLSLTWTLGACLSAPAEGGAGPTGEDSVELVPCEPVAFAEDFDQEGWQDARWAASDTSDGGELLAAAGRALITSDGDPDSYGWFGTEEAFDFDGRCLHVDVPHVFNHGDAVATEAYLGVYFGDVWIAVGQHRGQMCCLHERGPETLGQACSVAYSPEQHARWRLRFEAGEVACDAAPATEDWTEIGRLPYGGPTAGSIELLAGTWDEVHDVQGPVEFDDLNL